MSFDLNHYHHGGRSPQSADRVSALAQEFGFFNPPSLNTNVNPKKKKKKISPARRVSKTASINETNASASLGKNNLSQTSSINKNSSPTKDRDSSQSYPPSIPATAPIAGNNNRTYNFPQPIQRPFKNIPGQRLPVRVRSAAPSRGLRPPSRQRPPPQALHLDSYGRSSYSRHVQHRPAPKHAFMDNPERDELGSAGGWASSHSSHRAGTATTRSNNLNLSHHLANHSNHNHNQIHHQYNNNLNHVNNRRAMTTNGQRDHSGGSRVNAFGNLHQYNTHNNLNHNLNNRTSITAGDPRDHRERDRDREHSQTEVNLSNRPSVHSHYSSYPSASSKLFGKPRSQLNTTTTQHVQQPSGNSLASGTNSGDTRSKDIIKALALDDSVLLNRYSHISSAGSMGSHLQSGHPQLAHNHSVKTSKHTSNPYGQMHNNKNRKENIKDKNIPPPSREHGHLSNKHHRDRTSSGWT